MKAGIYKIEHKDSGKVYIGSSSKIKSRLSAHKLGLKNKSHHSILLQNAYNKYGEGAFIFETIIICAPENLLMYEQIAMDFYKSYDKKRGYNIRIKAESNRGLPMHPNTRAGIEKRWADPKFKEKMRQVTIERMKDPLVKAKFQNASKEFRSNNPAIEALRKRAAAIASSKRCKGVSLKPEHIKKISDTKKRKRASGEWVPKTKHGMTYTPEHELWCKMFGRCYNAKDAKFPTTGAQGIRVCDEWKDFEQFYSDMGPRPKGLFLGRKDITKGYNKENCRWSTPKMLSHSSRTVKLVLLKGEKLPLSEAARRLGIYPTSIGQRAKDFNESLQQATDHFARKKGML